MMEVLNGVEVRTDFPLPGGLRQCLEALWLSRLGVGGTGMQRADVAKYSIVHRRALHENE